MQIIGLLAARTKPSAYSSTCSSSKPRCLSTHLRLDFVRLNFGALNHAEIEIEFKHDAESFLLGERE